MFLAEAARIGDIRSVFFASATPGEGTTTTVLETARLLRESFNLKPLVIEWRRRKPSLAALLRLRPAATLERCLSDALPLSECIQQMKSGLAVVTSSEFADKAVVPPPEALRRLLDEARRDYDIVLIDSPPVLEEPEALLLARAVPHMVLVVRAGNTSEQSIDRVQQQMAGANVNIVGAVLNQYRAFIPKWISRWLIK